MIIPIGLTINEEEHDSFFDLARQQFGNIADALRPKKVVIKMFDTTSGKSVEHNFHALVSEDALSERDAFGFVKIDQLSLENERRLRAIRDEIDSVLGDRKEEWRMAMKRHGTRPLRGGGKGYPRVGAVDEAQARRFVAEEKTEGHDAFIERRVVGDWEKVG